MNATAKLASDELGTHQQTSRGRSTRVPGVLSIPNLRTASGEVPTSAPPMAEPPTNRQPPGQPGDLRTGSSEQQVRGTHGDPRTPPRAHSETRTGRKRTYHAGTRNRMPATPGKTWMGKGRGGGDGGNGYTGRRTSAARLAEVIGDMRGTPTDRARSPE